MIIIESIVTVLSADLISGLVHWAEDTFWTETTPVLGRWLVKPNVLHHKNGAAFIQKSWLQSSWDLLLAGLLVFGVCWIMGLLTWQVWLFLIISVNANQIHKWNHMNRTKIPSLIKLLQKCRLLQSSAHHARHHRGEKNTHYCVITDYLNPLLDRFGFWRGLEKLLVPLIKAPRSNDIKEIELYR